MKVVINRSFRRFRLSKQAYEMIGLEWDQHGCADGLRRDDLRLVEAVERLGDCAGGDRTKLCIVEIPDDVEWDIEECDGFEHVAEKHRTWP